MSLISKQHFSSFKCTIVSKIPIYEIWKSLHSVFTFHAASQFNEGDFGFVYSVAGSHSCLASERSLDFSWRLSSLWGCDRKSPWCKTPKKHAEFPCNKGVTESGSIGIDYSWIHWRNELLLFFWHFKEQTTRLYVLSSRLSLLSFCNDLCRQSLLSVSIITIINHHQSDVLCCANLPAINSASRLHIVMQQILFGH